MVGDVRAYFPPRCPNSIGHTLSALPSLHSLISSLPTVPLLQTGFSLLPKPLSLSSSCSPSLVKPLSSFFIYKTQLIPTTSQECLRIQLDDSFPESTAPCQALGQALRTLYGTTLGPCSHGVGNLVGNRSVYSPFECTDTSTIQWNDQDRLPGESDSSAET